MDARGCGSYNVGMEEQRLTHFDASGRARMVDVGAKAETERIAVARGTVEMQPETLRLILEGRAKKGDVLAVAQVAGIMAAKRTHELIPMCHPLLLTGIEVCLRAGRSTRARCTSRRRCGLLARPAWKWRRSRPSAPPP